MKHLEPYSPAIPLPTRASQDMGPGTRFLSGGERMEFAGRKGC